MRNWQEPFRKADNNAVSFQRLNTQHSKNTTKDKELRRGGQPPLRRKC